MSVDNRIICVLDDPGPLPRIVPPWVKELLERTYPRDISDIVLQAPPKMSHFEAVCIEETGRPPNRAARRAEARRLARGKK
ncbi:hypothetical protein LCGC14_1996260 [marine sediment metagenome]|uniref:Uncharacterized protein n=1 Tax=marine sediment metagenome TaxID=412755 RepID=A0A0F9F4V0_9ZZZZ